MQITHYLDAFCTPVALIKYVHTCATKNIFIVGDKEYGIIDKKFDLNGQLLHAEKITFIHPTTKKVMTFNAPLPDYFVDVLKKVAKQ